MKCFCVKGFEENYRGWKKPRSVTYFGNLDLAIHLNAYREWRYKIGCVDRLEIYLNSYSEKTSQFYPAHIKTKYLKIKKNLLKN